MQPNQLLSATFTFITLTLTQASLSIPTDVVSGGGNTLSLKPSSRATVISSSP